MQHGDYDVAVHNARVFAGGGQVPDNITTGKYEDLLKQAGLWDSCVFFGQADAGCTNDSTNHVAKVFDLKGNADLAQTTGTKQPKYQTDGTLLYDGGDFMLSDALNSGNAIKDTRVKFTVVCWASLASSTTEVAFCRWMHGDTPSTCHWLIEKTTADKLHVVIADGKVFPKNFTSTQSINGSFVHLAFTFDGSAMDGAVVSAM